MPIASGLDEGLAGLHLGSVDAAVGGAAASPAPVVLPSDRVASLKRVGVNPTT